MSGNAGIGVLLLNDPVFFYALQRNCDMESIFFIPKLFYFKFYRNNTLFVNECARKNINIVQGVVDLISLLVSVMHLNTDCIFNNVIQARQHFC